ncbi:MAG: metallopeptidase TldD-related protein [Pseudomonadota bacterium]|nr:metallopeptidase TldD-related protein [Pseudomonadota bacterium]
MKDYFQRIVLELFKNIQKDEFLIINFDAEESNFVRLNKARIRQPGNVRQISMSLSLSNRDKRNLKSFVRLNGDFNRDLATLIKTLNYLRRELPDLPKDPYLLFSKSVQSTEICDIEKTINDEENLDYIFSKVSGLDLVGIYSSGYIYTGLANSLGQFNWHSDYSFSFDYSIYNENNNAIKLNYSSKNWINDDFDYILNQGIEKLQILSQPPRSIKKGEYTVYLEPSALNEVIDMMSWGGFSYKANKIGTSPLHLLNKGERKLHPSVSITENIKDGISANFNADGFIKPDKINMISDGKFSESLTSPRSSLEYSVPHNASSTAEYPYSIDMNAGSVSDDSILSTINNGLYISNLWYLNFSDRNNGRMTGLTRFGCFIIENGKLTAPINTMRFDDSVYSMLGENLIGFTSKRELLIDSGTYEERSTSSARLPGALVNNFKMTL